ncbi:deoxyribose-phosphate aldolase [Gracilinema caldarium]|uniref:Deoxyribose-phosphate aldolase n=1 Tax=Gracilinema caldarium (strain ATCC 51460 / DSM 7334 / H1) TaxID=744872 RepID=F8F1L4_GRAC1|nr:deoxyribose-phosphate aldolase [Gracilinema caldarium]AEJ19067.1 Deoxyribose-phosphate aldolase [Gracilinema caldarium DSM 7334]
MSKEWTKATIAKTIDHTILKPTATAEQIRELCAEARANHFASVCVNPCWVPLVAKELNNSDVLVCTVIGFPLGANPTEIKVEETKWAVKNGAQEVDMVINIGALKGGDYKAVEEDIRAVVKAAGKATIKVIIETCFLSNDEKRIACEAAMKAGAHFVKTSTGFGTGGATVEDVKLMRKTVGDTMKVKASGGVRSYHDAIAMLDAGADRIGTSSGVAIVAELPE